MSQTWTVKCRYRELFEDGHEAKTRYFQVEAETKEQAEHLAMGEADRSESRYGPWFSIKVEPLVTPHQ